VHVGSSGGQTYLFGLLCKVGKPAVARDGGSIDVTCTTQLGEAAQRIASFLLEFFVSDDEGGVMRPLTNANVVLDFHRYRDARYYDVVTRYLRGVQPSVPDYEQQYARLLQYFRATKVLHRYDQFSLSATMSSTPNTKSLQLVCSTDDSAQKLGGSHYFKYRAANLMFGFNTGITAGLDSFCAFNALRKNQLLAFYEQLQPLFSESTAARRATSKYRDYYFMAQFEVGQPEVRAPTSAPPRRACACADASERAPTDSLASRVRSWSTSITTRTTSMCSR
jgi:hypothetical protein